MNNKEEYLKDENGNPIKCSCYDCNNYATILVDDKFSLTGKTPVCKKHINAFRPVMLTIDIDTHEVLEKKYLD